MRHHRSWNRAFAAVCLAMVFGLGAWCAWAGGAPEAFAFGDRALTELYTLHALRGLWPLGPYSRFGWHHPGPLYFYALAPFYAVSGQHGLAEGGGTLAINLLALAALAWMAWRHAPRSLALAMLASVSLYLARVPRVLTSAWNPHVLVLPYAALIVSCGIVAAGRLSLLPLAVTLASFVAQTHAGLAPSAAALTTGAVFAGVWRPSPSPRSPRFWIGVSAVALVVLWLPPCYEQMTARPGNLTQLVGFFFGGTAIDPTIDPRAALEAWAVTLTAPVRADFSLAYGNALPSFADARTAIVLAGVEVVTLGVAAIWAWRRGRRLEAAVCAASVMASLVAWLAIARIRGGLADHIVFWNTATGLVNAGAMGGVALFWIHDRVRVRRQRQRDDESSAHARIDTSATDAMRADGLVAIAALAVLIGAGIVGVAALQRDRAALVARSVTPPVGRLYQATRAAIARARFDRPLIAVRGAWSDAAGIILQLHKRHVPFGVESGEGWMFGAPIAARGDEDGVVIIADREHSHALAREPGDCLIAWAHGTFIHVRATTPGRAPGLACVPYDATAQ